jgi:diguanylate cyclase (GGDEF)-like protein
MGRGELAKLAELTSDALARATLSESLERVASAALDVLPADHASVRLDQAGELRSMGRAGVGAHRPAPSFRRGEGVLGWVVEAGQAARLDDARNDPRYVEVADNPAPVASLLCVPVRNGCEVAGVLTVCAEATHAFDADDEAIAALLANTAAMSVQLARLQELALTDSTTGAYNRRSLLPRLEEEMQRAQRSKEALSVLLMDLDHFKDVNDLYGHPVGDDVLRAFANEVRACVRAMDVLVRRGGEEFVLIMPGTEADAAEMVAQRICTRLAEQTLHVRGGHAVRQTVSIGVATWDEHESAEALDDRADQAMYEAKRTGRDRVWTAPRTSTLRPTSLEAAVVSFTSRRRVDNAG